MGGADFVLGLILAKLFGFGSGARRPAEVFAPSSPSSPSSPGSTPALPGSAVPQFPSNVDVPEPSPIPLPPPPAGFVKAVEVWRVKPSTAETAAVLVGAGASVMRELEKNFPRGWHAVPNVTAAEVAAAKALLPNWEEGKIIFAGPDTPSDRRAFRMTKHPKGTNPATAAPAPVAPPPTTIPASSTTAPSSAPGPLPPPFVPERAPEEMQRPPGATQITTVRKGEGLAQRAKALGRPENAASAAELQAANVPDGPGDLIYEKTALAQGGLKKKGRKGGLQPGDRLFVPRAWGPVDPARL